MNGAKREVGEVRLTNGIIQGDDFSSLLFVSMIDPIIKLLNGRVGIERESYYIDGLKESTDSIATAQRAHEPVKQFAQQLLEWSSTIRRAPSRWTWRPKPEPIQEIPEMDEVRDKYLGFEIKGYSLSHKVGTLSRKLAPCPIIMAQNPVEGFLSNNHGTCPEIMAP